MNISVFSIILVYPVVSKLIMGLMEIYWYWYRLLNFWYDDNPIRVYKRVVQLD